MTLSFIGFFWESKPRLIPELYGRYRMESIETLCPMLDSMTCSLFLRLSF
jgi:hypothetical protein